jgi:two-component system, OmpR family, sensor histidine kinase TctE
VASGIALIGMSNTVKSYGKWRLPAALRSSLHDLFFTHETQPKRDDPPLRSGFRRSTNLEPALLQRTLFGEVLDFMLAPLLLLWPLSIAVTFVVARSLADAPFDRAIEDRLATLAQEVKVKRGKIQLDLSRKETILLTTDDEDRVFFQVLGPSGNLISGESNLPTPALYDYPETNVSKLRNDFFQGEEIRVAYLYLAGDEDTETRLSLVQVAETLDKRARLANEIVKGVMLPQFIILPISVVLVWIALRHALRPLQNLRNQIRQRRPNDMSPVDPRDAPDEIVPLIETFNELLDRLSRNMRNQRRFIADAAHQIKTPLAGIRTQAELAQRTDNKAELQHTLHLLSRGSDRAARLVSQLLSLARTEHIGETLAFEAVNLVLLARTVTADWFPQASEANIDFGVETTVSEAVISGNAVLLTEMLGNLIDNAFRYAGTNAIVTVRVTQSSGKYVLEVEDNGHGVALEEQELVFERFYRAEGVTKEGSGLGLAIVTEVAELHKASVSVTAVSNVGPNRGARFAVHFS